MTEEIPTEAISKITLARVGGRDIGQLRAIPEAPKTTTPTLETGIRGVHSAAHTD